jgi:hypothetical protein
MPSMCGPQDGSKSLKGGCPGIHERGRGDTAIYETRLADILCVPIKSYRPNQILRLLDWYSESQWLTTSQKAVVRFNWIL